jgi:release factor glutamine methyltransferase
MQISEIISATPLSHLDIEVLLSHVLDKSKEWIFTHPDFEISNELLEELRGLEKKRAEGVSVAALVGSKEFFGLGFEVNENVLIPRPETEMLVEEILKLKPTSLLDVGTGSGCVAIAVKKNLPQCEVVASDVSLEALELARRNAEQNEIDVQFMESDLLEKVEKNFEIIVANLPYIPLDSEEVEIGVKKFEPNLALFGGADGLDLIRKLLTQISTLSQKPKFVLLEFGGGEQTRILEEFTKELFPNAVLGLKKDLAGIDRVLKLKP